MDTNSQTCMAYDMLTALVETSLHCACRDELRFIAGPEAYREHFDPCLLTGPSRDNSLWACDLCNHQISVTGENTLARLVASRAMCPACAACQWLVLFALARLS